MHSPADRGPGCCVGILSVSAGGRGRSSRGPGWLELSLYVAESALHGVPQAEVSAQAFCTRKSGLKCRL